MSRTDDTRRLPARVHASQSNWPHLVGIGGEALGLNYQLTKPDLVIGRVDDADIRLTSTSVSRRHAMIRMTATEVTVEDLGSRNGTYVNMDKIAGKRVLRDGDHLTFGDATLLKLSYEPGASAPPKGASSLRAFADPHAINRFYLLDRLRSEHAYACRHATPLTLVFFRVRDAAEEKAMREVTTLIRSSMGEEQLLVQTDHADLIALVLLDAGQAVDMAGRIHADIAAAAHQQQAASRAVSVTAVVVPLQVKSGVAAENILIAAYVQARKALERGLGPTIQTPPLDRDAAARDQRQGEPQ